uniref:Uncharacterized protein n=1 Tax=Arion vulgaris TaxID=1028688 RepID=A0A0B7AJ28_9EUPU
MCFVIPSSKATLSLKYHARKSLVTYRDTTTLVYKYFTSFMFTLHDQPTLTSYALVKEEKKKYRHPRGSDSSRNIDL